MRRFVVVLSLLVGACKEDDGAGSPASSGVPDACTLISEQELTTLLGEAQGTGKESRVSPDRSTCMYTSGLITAVEIAANYEKSKAIIEQEGRKTTPVTGVGQAAFWDEAGQLVAKGNQVFVGVTKFQSNPDELRPVAVKLLSAADK